jgi:predicted GNAT family acetyltransferase
MPDESLVQTVKRNLTPDPVNSNAAKGPGHEFDSGSPQAEGEAQYKEKFGSPQEIAYGKLKNWLSEHEQHFSDKVLKPFRAGLDNMAEDLQTAAETGHTKSGGQMNPVTRALTGAAGEALKMVPVGKDVKESAALMVPMDFGSLEGHTLIERAPKILHEPGEATNIVRLAQGDKTHGMVKYTMGENNEAAITAANLNPEMRGKGFGKKMYEEAAQQAKAKGATAITSDLAGTDSYDSGRVWDSLMKDHPDEITKIASKPGSPGYRWELNSPKASPKDVIEKAGLVYKGEVSKGTGVHQFEHPGHPGKTAALKESDITPEGVKNHMDSKLKDFREAEAKKKAVEKGSEGLQKNIDFKATAKDAKLPESDKKTLTPAYLLKHENHFDPNVVTPEQLIDKGVLTGMKPMVKT